MILSYIPPQFRVIILKFLDIFSRGLFVLIGTYGLQVVEAGQFGLLVTLISVFGFVFGFERQFDLQRSMVGKSGEEIQLQVIRTLRFYFLNYVFLTPVFCCVLFFLLKLSPVLVACAAVIVVAEHIIQQSYILILVDGQYKPLLLSAIIKNVGVLIAVFLQFSTSHHLSLDFIIKAWTCCALVGVIFCVGIWRKLTSNIEFPGTQSHSLYDLVRQYRRSYIHFTIGAVALLALQADRLIVGAMLQPVEIGVYFRNITLVSLAYQIFGIASYNRLSPSVYAQAPSMATRLVRRATQKEHLKIIAVCIPFFGVLWVLARHPSLDLLSRFHIDMEFQALFLLAFLLRTAGDLDGLLLNAKHMEKHLLRHQICAVLVGMTLSIVLTWQFGLLGTVVSSLCAPLVYWAANRKTLTIIED
jgi:O-antigen/teichoic acid export membrane protein